MIQTTDASGAVTVFEYDELGNLISKTNPDGLKHQYVFDALSRCTSKIWPSGSTWQYNYNDVGKLISKTDPKGVQINYTYDASNRLIQTAHPEGNVSWSYDPVGNLTGINNGMSLKEQSTFTYNQLNQLISNTTNYGSFVGNQTIQYTYDANGNRSSLTYPDGEIATYTYDAANRKTQLASIEGTTAFTYDNAGKLRTMTYANGMGCRLHIR